MPDSKETDPTNADPAAEGPPGLEVAPEQAPGRLLRLAHHLDRLEARLERLYEETRASADQLHALTRHLTGPDAMQPLNERLADQLSRLETANDRLDELSEAVTRLNRVHFKANTLAEGKEQQIARALDTLQEIVTRREEARAADEAERRQSREALRAEARAELAVDLLPVLDGLERALESGAALLERHFGAPADGPALPAQPGLWAAIRNAFIPTPRSGGRTAARREALESWLNGLELVRERFLRLLALEDIHPLSALEHPFDPRRHVAVGTVDRNGVPPGTIVEVVRKGYRQRERVLRYAEVIVARATASEEGEAGSSESAALSSNTTP